MTETTETPAAETETTAVETDDLTDDESDESLTKPDTDDFDAA